MVPFAVPYVPVPVNIVGPVPPPVPPLAFNPAPLVEPRYRGAAAVALPPPPRGARAVPVRDALPPRAPGAAERYARDAAARHEVLVERYRMAQQGRQVQGRPVRAVRLRNP
jgi:hypothetical protein